jgi:superfamily I DNA and/or RNA helicase
VASAARLSVRFSRGLPFSLCTTPRCVLVDEATQATEASALVAFCRGARQVALLGDQYQLPPTTVARHADALAASQPLFTRLVTEGLPALMLDTQYRMHPGIAMLPADLFYGGRLASGVACEERQLHLRLEPRGWQACAQSAPHASEPPLLR